VYTHWNESLSAANQINQEATKAGVSCQKVKAKSWNKIICQTHWENISASMAVREGKDQTGTTWYDDYLTCSIDADILFFIATLQARRFASSKKGCRYQSKISRNLPSSKLPFHFAIGAKQAKPSIDFEIS
jgi:hypothetical protein